MLTTAWAKARRCPEAVAPGCRAAAGDQAECGTRCGNRSVPVTVGSSAAEAVCFTREELFGAQPAHHSWSARDEVSTQLRTFIFCSGAFTKHKRVPLGVLPHLLESFCISSSCSCSAPCSKTLFQAPPKPLPTFLTNPFYVQGLWKASPQPSGTARQFRECLLSPSGRAG